jgi:hypothetical protein
MRSAARPAYPPRLLPLLYLAPAHVALVLAFAAMAIDPYGFASFFYHARMLAVVHLVTLGWITASILGALYLVAPIALRATLPARWPDYLAAALVWIGIIGMVAHFWIAEYSGMAWSGATVAAGVLLVAARVARPLLRAPISLAVRAHLALAFLNFAGASTMGVLLGIQRVHPFLPGFPLSNVFAHAHLAAIGWASLMVVGVGYRLLPMVLPAAMPSGRTPWTTAVLLEIGVCGLFVSLVLRSRGTWMFASLIVLGFAAFLGHVMWMLRHPRPRPAAIRTPDPAVMHAAAALVSLACACGLGLWLVTAKPSEHSLRVATAYGVLGLTGFLAQMVVAMKGRLLPLFAWYWAFEHTGRRGPVVAPHDMPWRAGQYAVFALWLYGVPALAAGLALNAGGAVRAAAWCLTAAALLDSAQAAIIVRHAFMRPARLAARVDEAQSRRRKAAS